MAHTIAHKSKLLTRLKKIKGQINALEKALETENECFKILQQIAAARGAMNALLNEVLQEHIKEHLLDANTKARRQEEIDNLLVILKSYFR
ncbi:hypothetical protein CQA38_07810 [Campylobacter sp. MIT 12-5580]|uniref:metal/formaldehyde-sensitive transcriptional repressor n=1 Tax=Campylobacter sp. MIT 12-5580 TaxID=2040651 RepID=UPI0010F87E04|nr:metal/formaldehyde-sensitive transcriptional repressor [Campylobacter sp. MIT 12-5580]TKX28410.1 hypothetical protein CQA38_07810 [Campylobacter sp. MIT 12-5580]